MRRGSDVVAVVTGTAVLLLYSAVVLAGAFLPIVAIWWFVTH